MPTNKQHRENERRRLQRQLEQRRERELARRKTTLITSIVGTLVVIAAVVVVIVLATGDDKSGVPAGSASGASTSPATSSAAAPTSSAAPKKAKAAVGPAVTFDGVTVKGAADLTGEPGVTSKATSAPAKLAYKDLVVGKGQAASPSSTVEVQYSGVLYKDGTPFDSSWSRGQSATFPLTGVVPGFTQGIGGTAGVPPMKVGGRRIMILPAALGYGASGQGPIPPNAPLVFVVDLLKVTG
jgi:FKBP-type peptidyl-prolyl cis-trans isomerase